MKFDSKPKGSWAIISIAKESTLLHSLVCKVKCLLTNL